MPRGVGEYDVLLQRSMLRSHTYIPADEYVKEPYIHTCRGVCLVPNRYVCTGKERERERVETCLLCTRHAPLQVCMCVYVCMHKYVCSVEVCVYAEVLQRYVCTDMRERSLGRDVHGEVWQR